MTSMGSNWAAFFLRKLLIPMRLMYGTEGAFQEVLMSCEVVYLGSARQESRTLYLPPRKLRNRGTQPHSEFDERR